MASLHIFLSQFLISCLLCTHSNAEPLVGKDLATPDEFKYYFTVVIVKKLPYHRTEDHLCTGSLIGTKYVLTSAECLHGNPKVSLQVVVGSMSVLAPSHKIFDIAEKTTYAQWFIQQGHKNLPGSARDPFSNICILELDTSKVDINPVAISYRFDVQAPQNQVTVLGWGHSQESKSPLSIKEAKMKFLSRESCEKRYQSQGISFTVPDGLACIVDDEKAAVAVNGDFGGPVLSKMKELIGILVGRGPMPKPHSRYPNPVNLVLPLSSYAEFIADSTVDNDLSPLVI